MIKWWCLFLVGSSLAAAPAPDAVKRVAESRQWHRLLHYRTTFPLFQFRSYIDGEEFFFAEDGHKNPLAELEASVAAFSKDIQVGKLKQHPQCAFPERYRFLKAELKLQTKDVKCEKFEEFLGRFNNPDSVSLIFSSAYPNNPGSMFGHTFLRINAKKPEKPGEKKMDMLDMGLNFAAGVGDDENPFAFILFGLTGGYQGVFSAMPYYVKVNEYSNSESRDLWEYELDFSPEETRRMLAHVWELETNTYFAYYFFDENCSYQLLALLETAKPQWDISYFPVAVIPSETVKRVTDTPGAVRSVKFRPSLRKKMVQQYQAMSDVQRDQFWRVLSRDLATEKVADPFVLDVATSYLYYQKQKEEGDEGEENKQLRTATLLRRSQLGEGAPPPLPDVSRETQADLGHFSWRLSASPGLQRHGVNGKTEFFQEIGFKTAYHDLLNNDEGFTRFSQIDFPNVTFRYLAERGDFFVENLELLHITSLFPLSFLEKRPSWKFQLDYDSPKDLACDTCHTMHVEAGVGLTFDLYAQRWVVYSLALANFEIGSALRQGYRFGPKLQLATIWNPLTPYKTRLAGNVFFDIAQNDRQGRFYLLEWDHSLSLSRSLEMRSGIQWILPGDATGIDHRELKFSLHFYF